LLTYFIAETNRIRNLRHPEQKMSKSDQEERTRIDIMDNEKIICDRVMKALTDFTADVSYDRQQRPGVSNLIDIYAGITDRSIEMIVDEARRERLNTGAFKKRLAEIIIEHFRPKRLEYLKLMDDQLYLMKVLDQGRERAHEIADKTLNEVKHIMGLN
jgi:tryptophanyl-tRNA synthetase